MIGRLTRMGSGPHGTTVRRRDVTALRGGALTRLSSPVCRKCWIAGRKEFVGRHRLGFDRSKRERPSSMADVKRNQQNVIWQPSCAGQTTAQFNTQGPQWLTKASSAYMAGSGFLKGSHRCASEESLDEKDRSSVQSTEYEVETCRNMYMVVFIVRASLHS